MPDTTDDLDLLAAIEEPTPDQERIATALVELRDAEGRCRANHYSDCLCGTLAARIRRILTEETP